MPKIKVWQTFTVEREIIVEIDHDPEPYLEASYPAPAFDDPNWKSEWLLTNEGVRLADV